MNIARLITRFCDPPMLPRKSVMVHFFLFGDIASRVASVTSEWRFRASVRLDIMTMT